MLHWAKKLFRNEQPDDDYNLGIILTEVMDVCTEKELSVGVKQHELTGKTRPLGECLIDIGAITKDQLKVALSHQKKLRDGNPEALLEALHTRADRKHASNERKKRKPKLVRTTFAPEGTDPGHLLAAK